MRAWSMPASRQVPYHDKLEKLKVWVEPINPKEIYFTEDAPEFDLIIQNGLDRPVVSRKDYGIFWVIGVGQESPDPAYWESIEVDLEPGGEMRTRIGGELMAYEGNGVVGINAGVGLRGGVDNDIIIIDPQNPGSGGYRWLYTFTVWDDSHYEAVHEQPKRLLEQSVKLSKYVLLAAAITAIVGIFQVANALGM